LALLGDRRDPEQSPQQTAAEHELSRFFVIHLVVGLVASIACAVLFGRAMLPRPGVTKANFEKIEIGMTRTEVDAILGKKGEPSEVTHIIGLDIESLEWRPGLEQAIGEQLPRRRAGPAIPT
jgi:hypothetical protein